LPDCDAKTSGRYTRNCPRCRYDNDAIEGAIKKKSEQ
jgi:hypothetical protein